ncbi:MAG: PDZ domain-containing protein [Fuerstia sp.]|nr:PDZ domain-containing protein [Fuerstiella sp.]
MLRSAILYALIPVIACIPAFAQEKKTRDQQVREDREKVTTEGFWIYNDLARAFDVANESGKPLLVVLRCIPCEECVKLDDELVDRDPVLRPLLEKFVCVRIVSTNGLDLSLFQFDTDQSFSVFMLNADRTIYGRFGTRSHRTDWIGDVSLKGLAEALNGALALHQEYPANRAALQGKTGPAPLFVHPENFPSLKEKFTSNLNYEGDVAKSCIHCHQIGDAVRDYYRAKGEAIPAAVLNPYPHPKSLGLMLDPDYRATVKTVQPDTIAAKAGFQAGDAILSLQGQPLLSLADLQWVLHATPAAGGKLNAIVDRSGTQTELTVSLPDGWRELDDISWRVSAWGLRRMATGGLVLEPVAADERGKHGIPSDGMALRVKHVGQYGPHAAAKNAGFQKDDVVVKYDSRSDLLTDSDVLRFGVTQHAPGDNVPVEVIRGEKRLTLQLPMQP